MSDVVSKITIALNDQASSGMKGIGAEVDSLRGKVSSFGSALSNIGTGIGISAGMAGLSGISDILSEGFSTSLRIENLDATYNAIYDGADKAKRELAFIRAEADRLGLSFLDTADSAKMFFAASKGSTIAKDARDIFSAFSELAVTMRLSKEQTSGMFLALGQSASKGKLMAQELREQLGEKVPGIFKVIADALGVTTSQLDKMLEEGKVGLDALVKSVPVIRERFGSALPEAVNSTTAAIGRLNTKWDDLMAHSANTDMLKAGITGLTGALDFADKSVVALSEHSDMLMSILATSITGYAALTAAKKISSSETLKAVASSAKERGALGAIRTSLLEVADAEYRKAQQTNAAAKSAVAAVEAEIAAAQRAKAALTASLSRVSGDEAVNAVRTRLAQTEARLASQTARASAAQKAARASADALAASSTRLNIAAGSVSGNVGKLAGAAALFKTAGSGLLAMLGGPWGVAFTAAAAGVGYLATQSAQADSVVDSLAEKFDQTAKAAASSGEAVKKFNAAYKEMLERSARQELGKAAQQLEAARKEAEAFTDPTMWNGMLDAIQRGASGWTTVSKIVSDYRSGLITSEEAFKRLNSASDRFGENNGNVAEGTRLVKALAQGTKEVADKEAGVAAVAKAAGEIGSAAATSALSVDDLAQALDVLRGMKLDSALLPDPSKMKLPALLTEIGKNLKNTEPFKKQAIETTKEWTKQAIAAAHAQLQSAEATGKDTSAIKATIEFLKKADEGVTDLGKSHKSQAGAANRAAKATSSYKEELAKLTQSSRELEQVKIEEKLRKIAKDAKLPAVELEKLRKAMEAEADFKWMQDILSYADPAAAAIAKENKEFEAFRRNIERLKVQDPAEYTRLMAKAETEHEKSLRKANRASKEQNEHTQEKLQFYKELEELTGQYGLSLKYQNELLEQQAELWRDADIPDGYINQWRELKELQSSREWSDGALRAFIQYRADATDAAKGAEEAFSSLYSGIDSGWQSVWQDMIETGKVSLSSFRSLFASFLADLMHMAITRPITVQIAGAVSGMFGGSGMSGVAGAASGGSGGMSNSLPTSWVSGISDTINSTMAGWFPDTFAPTAQFAANNAAAAKNLGYALGPDKTFMGTVGPYFTAAGLGSLGYSMFGGAIGLPQSKYSGLTAGLGAAAGWGLGGMAAGSAALAGTGMAAGATFGSVIPVAGTIIGAALGGLAGSLFGGERKTHPSVYTNVTDANLLGTDWKQAMTAGAWTDRSSVSDADPVFDALAEVATQTTTSILDFAKALPEQYGAQVMAGLENATISFGRGSTAGRGDVADRDPNGATWNFQFHDADQAQEVLTAAGEDFQRVAFNALQGVVSGIDMSSVFSALDVTTEEGRTKALAAMSSVNAITDAIDAIKTPSSQAEQQAQAFVEQMNALAESVKANGLNAEYADKLVGEYRSAYVASYVKSLDEMFSPLSDIETQAKSYKEAIDGYASALTTMGASEEQLATVRGYTQNAIDSITSSLDAAFFPLSEVETQTKATMESLAAYGNALVSLGATADELAKVDAARAKVQADLLDQVRAYVGSTPEVVAQAEAMNDEFDALRLAMEEAGNAAADLEELERDRIIAMRNLYENASRSFEQDVAQRYAAMNGTSDAVSRAISQENELRETIATFGDGTAQVSALLRLQAAENVYAAQSAVDNLQSQLNSLKQQAIQAEISAISEQLSAAKTLRDTWEKLRSSLRDSRTKLWTSDADALGLFARRDAAQAEFDRLYKLTMQGDEEAAGELAASGNTLLDLLKETASNSSIYEEGFWDVEQKLKAAEEFAGTQLSAAQKSYNALNEQLKAQNAMLEALGVSNTSLEAINAQIATVGKQLADALANLKIAQSSPSYSGPTTSSGGSSGGSAMSWKDRILSEKVASLNRGEYIDTSFGILAGSWNAANTEKAMIDTYGSVESWYAHAGKAEGFASGGLTPINEPFRVGEQGEEYLLSPAQYVALNAGMTRKLDELHGISRRVERPMSDYRLVTLPAAGTDGDVRAENAKLKEEARGLRKDLKEMAAQLKVISANTKELRNILQDAQQEGLLVRTVTA